MADKVKVISRRTPYVRKFLVTELRLVHGQPVRVPSKHATAVTRYSEDFAQNRGNIGFKQRGEYVELVNKSANPRQGMIHIKFPRLPIAPGDNLIDKDLLIEALDHPVDGARLLSFQGQPDGLIFRDPRQGTEPPAEATDGLVADEPVEEEKTVNEDEFVTADDFFGEGV